LAERLFVKLSLARLIEMDCVFALKCVTPHNAVWSCWERPYVWFMLGLVIIFDEMFYEGFCEIPFDGPVRLCYLFWWFWLYYWKIRFTGTRCLVSGDAFKLGSLAPGG